MISHNAGFSIMGTRRDLRVFTMAEIRALPERDYILKGMIAPGEMSVIWGPPKSGKTFLVTHLSYAIAQGRRVLGRRVKPARVLYVSAEGESGIKGRLVALESHNGTTDDFLLIAQPVDLLDPDADIEPLIQAARQHRPGLIVLDTLNRVMAGGDENSPQDMGALIRHIDRIRHETKPSPDQPGAHVSVIHHGTKAGNNGPRGHGSLIGAADLVIEISKGDDGLRKALVTHCKDDPDGDEMHFKLETFELGPDADGDMRTTCLVSEIMGDDAAAAKSTAHLTPTERTAMRIMHDTIAGPDGALLPDRQGFPSGLRGVPEEALFGEFETRGLSTAETRDSRNKARGRALSGLKDKGLIATRDRWWWATRPSGQAAPR